MGGGTKPNLDSRNFSIPGSVPDRASETPAAFAPAQQNLKQPSTGSKSCRLPEDFVHLKSVDSSIQQDMRYSTTQNVFGNKPLPGYKNLGRNARNTGCVLNKAVAESLKKAQQKLKRSKPNLSLMVYDCFRPTKAQEQMKKHNSDSNSVAQGISHHSRGLAVDITIVDMSSGSDQSLNMGSDFDDFKKSNYNGSKNQKMLRSLMSSMGGCWKPHNGEWWHFVYTCKGKLGAKNFDIPSYESCHGKDISSLLSDDTEKTNGSAR